MAAIGKIFTVGKKKLNHGDGHEKLARFGSASSGASSIQGWKSGFEEISQESHLLWVRTTIPSESQKTGTERMAAVECFLKPFNCRHSVSSLPILVPFEPTDSELWVLQIYFMQIMQIMQTLPIMQLRGHNYRKSCVFIHECDHCVLNIRAIFMCDSSF